MKPVILHVYQVHNIEIYNYMLIAIKRKFPKYVLVALQITMNLYMYYRLTL